VVEQAVAVRVLMALVFQEQQILGAAAGLAGQVEQAVLVVLA
jgi:hypothetical protein